MILCYALGGGLGHLTRMRALLHTLGEGVGGEPVNALVSSPLALDPRALGGWAALLAPAEMSHVPAALGAWVAAAVLRLRPRVIYVDAFPGGILGELCGMAWPAGTELFHAARRLSWPRYSGRLARPGGGPLPQFAATYVLEPLEPDHHAALAGCSRTLAEQTVADPPAAPAPPAAPPISDEPSTPPADAWLVVHSGPAPEILQLIAYAESLQLLEGSRAPLALIAPRRPELPDGPPRLVGLPEAVAHFDLYPAWPLFTAAPRIVTACGFNVMRQAARHHARHRYMPFPRPLDDQFVRASWRR
jgi:hypothetical protein